jgi:hypothetical protein
MRKIKEMQLINSSNFDVFTKTLDETIHNFQKEGLVVEIQYSTNQQDGCFMNSALVLGVLDEK